MSALRSRIFLSLSAGASALTLESLKANPLVPGVSVIMQGPAKGHFRFDENDQPVPVFIDETTLQQVMDCAQTYSGGLRVNAGHFTGVLDAAAFLANYRIDGENLRADMTLFDTFEKFEHLCTLIATIPDTFGLSIDFSGPSDFREGKAFARCTEIYSADLVPVPAANDRGLFAAVENDGRWIFCAAGKITRTFDTPENNMTLEELSAELRTAVTNLNDATTKFNAATGKIDGVVTKVAGLETALAAIKIPEGVDLSALSTQLGEVKTLADDLKSDSGDLRQKLASRMGIEFAARAGAKPASGKKEGESEGGDQRKAFEIPSGERNTEAVRELLSK